MGAIAFTPLAQGLLTDKYLGDGTADRAQQRSSLPQTTLSGRRASRRCAGSTSSRRSAARRSRRWRSSGCCAIRWSTSALIGASRTEQLDENLAALDGPAFTTEELEQIDALSDGIDVDLWAESTQL